MKFNVFTEMEYVVKSASTLIMNINALNGPNQKVLSEQFTVSNNAKLEELPATAGENRMVRFEVDKPDNIKLTYKATVDNNYQVIDFEGQYETPVAQLDHSIIPYLYPSRYCQSDKLYRLANDMFGKIVNPFTKVIAITDWIYWHVEYLGGSTNSETSAFDTVTQRQGVCRDFAHLGIALCRALTIPARYFTGYAYQLQPPDFHACFEAYINGHWILFDATKLVPLNGMIKIATGRDAADAAIANIFGDAELSSIVVSCDLADDGFEPMNYGHVDLKGIAYL